MPIRDSHSSANLQKIEVFVESAREVLFSIGISPELKAAPRLSYILQMPLIVEVTLNEIVLQRKCTHCFKSNEIK